MHNPNIKNETNLFFNNIVEKKTYSYNEAYEASLEYFKGDELAAGNGLFCASESWYSTHQALR